MDSEAPVPHGVELHPGRARGGGLADAWRAISTPIGTLIIHASPNGVRRIAIGAESESRGPRSTRDPGADALAARTARQLEEYFLGERRSFDLPLDPRGTSFQRSVWGELLRIPFGQTTIYARLASAVGKPNASRAVGLANGANPIGVLIPCHRVIGSNGSLTGYAGGIDRKAWLLRWEGAPMSASLFADRSF